MFQMGKNVATELVLTTQTACQLAGTFTYQIRWHWRIGNTLGISVKEEIGACINAYRNRLSQHKQIVRFHFLSPISNKIHYMQAVIILFLESTEKSELNNHYISKQNV